MQTYEALLPIRHNGARLAVGETVKMSEKDAKPLIYLGYLMAVIDESKIFPPEDSDEDIIIAITETLFAVFGDGDKAEKKPSVNEVQTWMKRKDINAALRDAAWQRYLDSDTGQLTSDD